MKMVYHETELSPNKKRSEESHTPRFNLVLAYQMGSEANSIPVLDEGTYKNLERKALEICGDIFDKVQEGNPHTNLNEQEYIQKILPEETAKLIAEAVRIYLSRNREIF